MPLNMNSVPVEIKQYDNENTVTSKYFKEPAQAGTKAYKNTIQIEAQVNTAAINRRLYLGIGDDQGIAGYLVVLKDELDDLNVQLKPGDIITKIGNTDVDYRIVSVNEDSKMLSLYDFATPLFILIAFVNNKPKVGGVL